MDNNTTVIPSSQESVDSNLDLHAALKPLATTAHAVAVRDDIVAEILNLRAEIANQLIVLRGDLVGQIEAMRREPVDEREDLNTQIRELRQEVTVMMRKMPTARQLILAFVAENAVVAAIAVAVLFVLR